MMVKQPKFSFVLYASSTYNSVPIFRFSMNSGLWFLYHSWVFASPFSSYNNFLQGSFMALFLIYRISSNVTFSRWTSLVFVFKIQLSPAPLLSILSCSFFPIALTILLNLKINNSAILLCFQSDSQMMQKGWVWLNQGTSMRNIWNQSSTST